MYFGSFPTISYNNKQIKNIILKSRVVDAVLANYDTFHPYVVQDGERPDTIAHDYYGTSAYDWLIVLTNQYIDPYFQWPLPQDQLLTHLQEKHGKTIPELKTEIKHYVYTGIGGSETALEKARNSWTMSATTFSYFSAAEKSGWTPVYTYDFEIEENDARRSIKLLDRIYAGQALRELQRVLQ